MGSDMVGESEGTAAKAASFSEEAMRVRMGNGF